MHRFGPVIVACVAALALGACDKSSKQDQLAYEACLASAKKDAKIGAAAFATLEQSKITGSTGEEEMRVNIPYELDGKKQTYPVHRPEAARRHVQGDLLGERLTSR